MTTRTWPLYLLIIIGLSSIPGNPGGRQLPLHIDKVAHFCLYGGLGFLFILNEPRLLGRSALQRLGLALILAALVGLGDEAYQGLIPNRTREVLDWTADVLGCVAGAGLAMLLPFGNGRREGGESQ